MKSANQNTWSVSNSKPNSFPQLHRSRLDQQHSIISKFLWRPQSHLLKICDLGSPPPVTYNSSQRGPSACSNQSSPQLLRDTDNTDPLRNSMSMTFN